MRSTLPALVLVLLVLSALQCHSTGNNTLFDAFDGLVTPQSHMFDDPLGNTNLDPTHNCVFFSL